MHASRILAHARPLLLDYLNHQQQYLQNELLRLNSVKERQFNDIQGELHRARQAEREALGRQESPRQERKSFLEKAMRLKESLEEYKRENKLLKEKNTKLAQIALRLNKVVSSDRSAVTISDLRDRITFLEQRLKKASTVRSCIYIFFLKRLTVIVRGSSIDNNRRICIVVAYRSYGKRVSTF